MRVIACGVVLITFGLIVHRVKGHDELFVLGLNGTVEEVVSKWNEKGVNK